VLKKLMPTISSRRDIEAIEARGTPMCASQICDPKAVKVRPKDRIHDEILALLYLGHDGAEGQNHRRRINLKYCSDPDVLEMIDRITFITDESIAVKGHMPAKLRNAQRRAAFCGEQNTKKAPGKIPLRFRTYWINTTAAYQTIWIAVKPTPLRKKRSTLKNLTASARF
jgi:hypothetical protein